jgi:hypothetical protein
MRNSSDSGMRQRRRTPASKPKMPQGATSIRRRIPAVAVRVCPKRPGEYRLLRCVSAQSAGLDTTAATSLIRERMKLIHEEASRALERDLTY